MRRIMRTRPLTTVITLGVLVCGATVGLEAMGVLFQPSDPEQRTEAFLARLESDFDSMVSPSRPVDLPSESEQEPPWQQPDRAVAAEAARAAGPQQAEDPRAGEPEPRGGDRIAAAVDGAFDQGPALVAAAETDAGPAPAGQEPTAPVLVRAAVHAVEAVPPPRRAQPARVKWARASTAGGTSTGCPVLDWLSQ
jgi:hypothetical protein